MKSLTGILFLFCIHQRACAQLQLQWNTVNTEISESNPIVYAWQREDLSTHILCTDLGNNFLYNNVISISGDITIGQQLFYPDSLRMLSFKGLAYDNLNNFYVAGMADLGLGGTHEVVAKYAPDLTLKWEYFSPDSVSLIKNAIHRSGDTTIVVSVSSVGMLFTSLHNSGQQVETNFTYNNKYFEFPDLVAYPQNRIVMGFVSDSSILVYVYNGHGSAFNDETIEIEGFTGLLPMSIAYDDSANYYFQLLGYDDEDSLSKIILQVNASASLNWMKSTAFHKNDLYATLDAKLYVDEDNTLIASTVTQTNDDSVYINMQRYDVAGTIINQRKLNASEWLDPDLSATSAYRASTDMLYVYFPRMQSPDYAGIISMSCNSDWMHVDTLDVAFSEALAQCYAFTDEEDILTLVNLKTDVGPLRNIEVSQFKDTYVGIHQIENPSPIEIFPNPCADYIICALKGQDVNVTSLVITDLAGRKLIELEDIYSDRVSINTSQLVPGIYQLTIIGSAFRYSETLVKQ